MIMLSQGNSPENPTTESITKAVDLVREQKDKGQIRRFTGNDYADDLAAGNIAVAQAYSGDVVQLHRDVTRLRAVGAPVNVTVEGWHVGNARLRLTGRGDVRQELEILGIEVWQRVRDELPDQDTGA